MSFSINNRNNVEGDSIITRDTSVSDVYGFFSLFGNMYNALKGQTIRYNGKLWEKSEKKTFL